MKEKVNATIYIEKIKKAPMEYSYGITNKKYLMAVQWAFRVGGFFLLLIGLLLLFSSPSISTIIYFLIIFFGSIICFIFSDVNGLVAQRKINPIIIFEDSIELHSSFLEEMLGKHRRIHINQINQLSISMHIKPNSHLKIGLQRMPNEIAEIIFHLCDGTKRYSGPKPIDTVRDIINILKVKWNIECMNRP